MHRSMESQYQTKAAEIEIFQQVGAIDPDWNTFIALQGV